jgi:hypothetical protein
MTGLHLLKVSLPPTSTNLGTNPSIHGPLGIFNIQTTATGNNGCLLRRDLGGWEQERESFVT